MSSAEPARRFFFIMLAAATALLAFVAMPLASSLFLAATFAGAVWPWHRFLARKLGGRPRLSASIFVFTVIVLIVGPLVSFSAFVVSESAEGYEFLVRTVRGEGVRQFVDQLPDAMRQLGHQALDQFGAEGESIGPALQQQLTSQGRSAAMAVGATLTATGMLLFKTAMMLIAFFLFLVHGAEVVAWLDGMSPLRHGQTQELLTEFKKVSLAVLVSMVVTAAVQAVAALGGFLMTGVPHPVFFFGVTFFAALVPAVGASVICFLAALVLLATGHPYAALFLSIWGLIVVGLVDNLVKPMLIRSGIQMNSGIVFFSLIGGLVAFGGIGLLLGPLVVALVLSLLRMYQRDFRAEPAETSTRIVV